MKVLANDFIPAARVAIMDAALRRVRAASGLAALPTRLSTAL